MTFPNGRGPKQHPCGTLKSDRSLSTWLGRKTTYKYFLSVNTEKEEDKQNEVGTQQLLCSKGGLI